MTALVVYAQAFDYEDLALIAMEVQFTPEQEARILQIANYNGIPAEQLVGQAVLRLIE